MQHVLDVPDTYQEESSQQRQNDSHVASPEVSPSRPSYAGILASLKGWVTAHSPPGGHVDGGTHTDAQTFELPIAILARKSPDLFILGSIQ